MPQYPQYRPRRLRRTAALRSLVRETHVHVDDLIQPYFVTTGTGVRRAVGSMPGVEQTSVDGIVADARLLVNRVSTFAEGVEGTRERIDNVLDAVQPDLPGTRSGGRTFVWLLLTAAAVGGLSAFLYTQTALFNPGRTQAEQDELERARARV